MATGFMNDPLSTSDKFEKCFLKENVYYRYICSANTSITTDDLVFSNLSGNHLSGKTNSDVEMLVFNRTFEDQTLDINYIPSGISDVLPSLVRFFLQFAKLSKLSRKSFRNMSKLRVISLTNNLIEHIDEDTFYEVPELSSLRINGNRLKSIPFNLLIHSYKLEYLVMNKNQIEEFNADIFRHCSLISHINLNHNELKKIQINLSNYSKLNQIYLENNHCISSSYTIDDDQNTLQELQNQINTNC